jgi:hypothetical protein
MFAAALRSPLIVAFALIGPLTAGCGRKGPPLPPLVRVPAAPGELTAERRGETVEIGFTIPATNTDKTRPANIERVDVYAYTGPAGISDADIVRRGERVGAVEVKAPRNPNRTIEPGDPSSDLEPLEGPGLDQGTPTRIFDELEASPSSPGPPDAPSVAPPPPIEDGRPLTGPPCAVPTRVYLGVGVSTSGRPGAFSRRAAVPLMAPPPAPSAPTVTYDERAVTIQWTGAPAASADAEPDGALPSRPVGCGVPAVGYHVYEVKAELAEARLTTAPVREPLYADERIEWGAERCYTVRTVHTTGGLSVESEPAAPVCQTLRDTFAPAAPKGLITLSAQGRIDLIWDANTEKDLAGYLVLRTPAAERRFEAITPEPIPGTTFNDAVEPGILFVYAIQAVDTAGNRSEPSGESTPEAAR